MNIINLTPHDINILDTDGNNIETIVASGNVARVSTSQEVVGEINGIPVVETVFGEVEGIPAPQENTVYLVSTLILNNSDRTDLIAPDTGRTAIRVDGRIVGVTRFQV